MQSIEKIQHNNVQNLIGIYSIYF